nr:hypothetical protein [Lysinibacillus timonensis]
MKMFMIGYIFLLGIAFFVISFYLWSLWMVGSYLFIALVLFTWGYVELKKELDKRKENDRMESEEYLREIPHTKYTLSEDLLNSLLIDENHHTFYVANRDYIDVDFKYKSFPFSKITEVAIVEDGVVKYLFPKDGSLGGKVTEEGIPIINIINSNDAEKEDDEEYDTIKKLKLKVVIDDFSNHTIEYTFMENDDGIDTDSEEYKDAIKECTHWYQMICLIINQYKHEKRLVGPWV